MKTTPTARDRVITRFARSHRNDWSEENVNSAMAVLNRLYDFLQLRDATLLHDDVDELVELIEDYIDERATTPSERTGKLRAGSTLQFEHRQIAAFYKWATLDQGDGDRLLRRNPMRRIPAPDAAPPDPQNMPVAEDWQYDAMLATCRRRKNRTPLDRRDAAILAVLWHTGMRRSELVAVDLDRVDFDREAIYLPRTKGGRRGPKSRWVPLVDEAMAAIDLWIDVRGHGDGPLFTSQRGGRLTADSVNLMLRRRGQQAAAALGIEGTAYTTPHSFRRSSAIAWLDNGGAETTLMTNHGWSTGAMIRLYTGAKADELAATDAQRVATARRAGKLRSVS